MPAQCAASASRSSTEVASSGTQCLARKLDCTRGKSQLFHTTVRASLTHSLAGSRGSRDGRQPPIHNVNERTKRSIRVLLPPNCELLSSAGFPASTSRSENQLTQEARFKPGASVLQVQSHDAAPTDMRSDVTRAHAHPARLTRHT